MLGFEQATKYTVYDETGNIVALIAEEITGIGNEIQRQLLRTRRSFVSTVLSADGEWGLGGYYSAGSPLKLVY